jgi:hypothetical protein
MSDMRRDCRNWKSELRLYCVTVQARLEWSKLVTQIGAVETKRGQKEMVQIEYKLNEFDSDCVDTA